jgi:hypothetical protein
MAYGKLLPMHPKPLEDELLSSWWFRLARANCEKLHTFTRAIVPNVAIWNRDIDRSVTDDVLQVLAAKTGTSLERVRATTLRDFEGRLFERFNANGNCRWILPIGIYHRSRRLYGLQYCPLCLREDEVPYFRRLWRLSFVTMCPKHWMPLLDRCSCCGEPVAFHRRDLRGPRSIYPEHPITLCQHCELDLRDAQIGLKRVHRPVRLLKRYRERSRLGNRCPQRPKGSERSKRAKPKHASRNLTRLGYFQAWLLEGLALGKVNLDELQQFTAGHRLTMRDRQRNVTHVWGAIPSFEYFDVLQLVVTLLSTDCGRRSGLRGWRSPDNWVGHRPNLQRVAFCTAARQAISIRKTISGTHRPKEFSYFSVEERRIIMMMTSFTMQHWPHIVRKMCKKAGLQRSIFFRDLKKIPKWLDSIFQKTIEP